MGNLGIKRVGYAANPPASKALSPPSAINVEGFLAPTQFLLLLSVRKLGVASIAEIANWIRVCVGVSLSTQNMTNMTKRMLRRRSLKANSGNGRKSDPHRFSLSVEGEADLKNSTFLFGQLYSLGLDALQLPEGQRGTAGSVIDLNGHLNGGSFSTPDGSDKLAAG